MEPAEVVVVIHSACGLQGKKKDRHKYSVIFGFGANQFRTSINKEGAGNPAWSEESTFQLEPNCEDDLLMVVTEKEDILGQASLPLNEIQGPGYHRPVRSFLQPHKKCPKPYGQLTYECWVAKYREREEFTLSAVTEVDEQKEEEVIKKHSKLSKLKKKIEKSPLLGRKFLSVSSKKLDEPDLKPNLPASKGNSVSMQNLSFNNTPRNRKSAPPSSMVLSTDFKPSEDKAKGEPSSDIHKRFTSFTDLQEENNAPEVTGISPKEGPIEGGTRLTLRGINLGVDKADVVGLFVCGSNVLATLEYESQKKLYCTTKSWKPGSGHIVVETQAGGKGKSLIQFTFVLPRPETPPQPDPFDEPNTEVDGNSLEVPVILRTPPTDESPTKEGNEVKQRWKSSIERASSFSKVEMNRRPFSTGSHGDVIGDKLSPDFKKKTNECDTIEEKNEENIDKDETNILSTWISETKKHKEESQNEAVLIAKKKEEKLLEELKSVEFKNKELNEQNKLLHTYINRLVAKVLIKCPEALSKDEEIYK